MKKVSLLIALAALVLFAGCKKENDTKGVTLKASIEQNKGNHRTSLNPANGAINWTAGDKILVNNGSSNATFTLTGGAGTTEGTFTYNGDYEFGTDNVAVYPQTATINGNTVNFTLPEEQVFTAAGTFGNGANPMLGTFTDTDNLTFTSLCGGLGLSLTGDNVAITGIEIVSANENDKLNGAFECTVEEPTLVAALDNAGTNRIMLNCATTLTDDPQEFYFVLPVGVLAEGFTLNVYNGGEEPIFTKSTESTELVVALNTVKTMSTLEVESGLIVMERKYLVHHGGAYNYPAIHFFFDNGQSLSIGYFRAYYWGGWSGSIQGIHIISAPFDGYDIHWAPDAPGEKKDWYVAPVVLDEWVNEKIIIYPSGRVQYYMNDEYMGEELFDLLHLEEVGSLYVMMEPAGWWTGHYHYVDDFFLKTPAATISDNFDDGVIDLNIWNAPANPDGVFEQNGILELHQYRTDQDFRLFSKPFSLH